MYLPSAAGANDDAAHALAEKFSQAGEESQRNEEAKAAKLRAKAQAEAKKQADAAKRKAAAERRAADEAEMLRAAKEEAETRRKHDQAREQQMIEAERQAARAEAQRLAEEAQKQKAEMERKAEVERSAEAARLQREVDEQRSAEDKRLADERRVAEEKKAEEARVAEAKRQADEAEVKRKAEEARLAEVKRQAEQAEANRKAEEARVAEVKRQAEQAEAKRKAEEARIAELQRIEDAKAAAQRTALEAEREKEAQRIAEKFRLAREARERNNETRSTLGGPMPEREPPSPFIEAPALAQTTYPQRVTVLVIMQPRRHGFGGARMTANPVLCVGQECYVSNGASSPATIMGRARALGPGNTLGRNAGVCRNQTTCVFRGITLSGPMSTIQPVDMGFLRHDRRETRTVEVDRSCDASAGALNCSSPIVSTGYRAWIIPEAVADKAGAQVLMRALDDGLPAARSASYGGWGSTVQALPTR
jgi:colicin import membrane protein